MVDKSNMPHPKCLGSQKNPGTEPKTCEKGPKLGFEYLHPKLRTACALHAWHSPHLQIEVWRDNRHPSNGCGQGTLSHHFSLANLSVLLATRGWSWTLFIAKKCRWTKGWSFNTPMDAVVGVGENSIDFGSAPRREADRQPITQLDRLAVRNTHSGFFVSSRHGYRQWGEQLVS